MICYLMCPKTMTAPREETGQTLEGGPLLRVQMWQGDATEGHQTTGEIYIMPAGQSRTPGDRPRAASAAPRAEASTPSSKGGGGSVARSR